MAEAEQVIVEVSRVRNAKNSVRHIIIFLFSSNLFWANLWRNIFLWNEWKHGFKVHFVDEYSFLWSGRTQICSLIMEISTSKNQAKPNNIVIFQSVSLCTMGAKLGGEDWAPPLFLPLPKLILYVHLRFKPRLAPFDNAAQVQLNRVNWELKEFWKPGLWLVGLAKTLSVFNSLYSIAHNDGIVDFNFVSFSTNTTNLDKKYVQTPRTQLLFWINCWLNKNIKTTRREELRICPHCMAVSVAFVHIFGRRSWCLLNTKLK